MAKRVNTKFVAALAGAVILMGVAVAAVILLTQKDANQYFLEAQAAEESGRYGLANRTYKQALKKDPNYVPAIEGLISVLPKINVNTPARANNLYRDYMGFLKRATEVDLSNNEALERYLNELFEIAQYAQIYTDASLRLENQPDNPIAMKYRGAAYAFFSENYRGSGDRARALNDLDAALIALPGDALVQQSQIRIRLLEARDLQQARQTEAATERVYEAIHLALAMIAHDPDDIDRQMRFISTAGTVTPKQRFVSLKRLETIGQAMTQQLSDPEITEEVIRYVDLLVRVDRRPYELYENQAPVSRGMFRATQILEQAVQAHPNDPRLKIVLARFYNELRQTDRALDTYRLVLSDIEDTGFEQYLVSLNQKNNARFNVGKILLERVLDTSSETPEEDLTEARQMLADLRQEFNDSHTPQTLLLAGMLEMEKGNQRQALELFNEGVNMSTGQDSDLLLWSYQVGRQLGESGVARSRLEAFVEMEPTNTIARATLAEEYLIAGDRNPASGAYELARSHAEELVQFQPENVRHQWLLARSIVGATQSPVRGLEILQPVDFMSYPPAINSVASWLSELGDEEQALMVREAWFEANPSDPRNLYELARNADPERQQALLAQAEAAGMDEAVLGRIRTIIGDDTQARNELFSDLIQSTRRPQDRVSQEVSQALQQGDFDQAQSLLATGLEDYPDNIGMWYLKIELEVIQDNIDEAERVVAEMRERNVDGAQGAFGQGLLQMLQGNHDAARNLFRRGVRQAPTYSEGYALLGQTYLAQGEYDAAIEEFQRAVDRGEMRQMQRAQTGLFHAYHRLGDHDSALQTLRMMNRNQMLMSNQMIDTYLAYEQEYGDREQVIAMRTRIAAESPNWGSNLRTLVLLLADEGETDAALEWYERFRAQADDPFEAVSVRAAIDLASGDDAAALARVESYVLADGHSPTEAEWLQVAGYRVRNGDSPGAFEAYQQARILEDPQVKQATRELAARLFESGAYEQADPLMQELYDTFPEDQGIAEMLLENRLRLGNLDSIEEIVTRMDQGRPVIWLARSRVAELRGEHDEAISIAEQGLAQDNLNGLYRARLLAVRGRSRAALVSIAGLDVRLSDDRQEIRVRLADPIRDMEEARRLDPDYLLAWSSLGQLYSYIGETERAAQIFRDLVERAPYASQFRVAWIDLLTDQGAYEAAMRAATDGAELQPDEVNWPLAQAQIATASEDWSAAAEHWGSVSEMRGTLGDVFNHANALILADEPEEALELAEAHPEFFSQDFELTAIRAQALAKLSQIDAATAVFVEAWNNSPSLSAFLAVNQRARDVFDTRDLALAMQQANDTPNAWRRLGLAKAMIFEERYEDAHGLLADVASQYRAAGTLEQVLFYRDWSLVLQKTNRYEEAREAYSQLVQLEPTNWVTLNNYAYLLTEDLNEPESALPLAEQAVEISGSPYAMDTLAWTFYKLQRYNDASDVLDRALAIDNTIPELYLHLGMVYAGRGETRRADLTLRQAIRVAESADNEAIRADAEEALRELLSNS